MFSSTDEALRSLVPFAVDKNNPLWDSGLIFISKDSEEKYLVELTGFYYESEEDIKTMRPYEKEREISFDVLHKSVYDYLQAYYTDLNPKIKWDRLVLEVRKDNSFTPHYEFEGEEVSPDAPPEPETLTAAYLCENLRNCLSHKAPDNYKWVWEVLSRAKTIDGKTQIGGEFYYSVYEDKTDPQKLEPGEYIFMYNVSMRLFDEFFPDQTKNWSQIVLEFSKEGSTYFRVLKQEFN